MHLQLFVPQLEDHLVLQARVGICQLGWGADTFAVRYG
jgi:hypothetical protein